MPIGNLNTVIKNNLLKQNRYGITISGGNNINALISYNRIEDNNTDNNPATGGSGISLGGGSATSHQNTIVTGNLIKGNLWGITILNFAKPNLGNLSNADTSDNGKNFFVNNINISEPQSDLYNNTPDDISAQGNYWNGYTIAIAETHIFHKVDNASLGLVDFGLLQNTVQLLSFNVTAVQTDAWLQWSTASELYSASFDIEKSTDGTVFTFVSSVQAAGISNTNYFYTDFNAGSPGTRIYYRLKLKDLFGNFIYSSVKFVDLYKSPDYAAIRIYPTLISGNEKIYAEIPATHAGNISVQFLDAGGRLLGKRMIAVNAGSAKIVLNDGIVLPHGAIFVRIDAGQGLTTTIRLMKNK